MNKRLHHVSLEQIMLFFKKMWGQHADLHEQIPYVCMYELNKSTGVENNACSCVCVCVCTKEKHLRNSVCDLCTAS